MEIPRYLQYSWRRSQPREHSFLSRRAFSQTAHGLRTHRSPFWIASQEGIVTSSPITPLTTATRLLGRQIVSPAVRRSSAMKTQARPEGVSLNTHPFIVTSPTFPSHTRAEPTLLAPIRGKRESSAKLPHHHPKGTPPAGAGISRLVPRIGSFRTFSQLLPGQKFLGERRGQDDPGFLRRLLT